MALQPVTRRSVPDQVFGQIAADVLSGELQPDAALPSERQMAELFGVSRPAIREALKRLSAAGLITVRQGGGTTVRDFRQHASLDLLPQLLFRDGNLDPAVVESLLAARLRNGPKVAELAAERHDLQLTEALTASLRELSAEPDPAEWHRLTLKFWDHVVDGAGSIVFRLMYNAFRTAYEPALLALNTTLDPASIRPDDYRRLAEAICTGDAAAAKKIAHEIIERANTALGNAFEQSPDPR